MLNAKSLWCAKSMHNKKEASELTTLIYQS